MPTRFVDTEDALAEAVATIARSDELALDSEGVQLGRTGALTIATFSGIGTDEIFVVDVQVLGGDRVFAEVAPSFRSILEKPEIKKITFDCRMDSDALLHQFGVTLRGTVELQVLDQAVRIQNGEAPPQRNIYVVNGQVSYLKGMAEVAKRYSVECAKVALSHTRWDTRPLPGSEIEYAATDVAVIKELYAEMRKVELPAMLHDAVQKHSARYEDVFRSRAEPISCIKGFCVRHKYKDEVMEELPIVDAADLPLDHPRNPVSDGSSMMSTVKWRKAVATLRSREQSSTVFDDCLYIMQHNDWYTDAGRAELQRLAKNYPYFTPKQRGRIGNPPKLSRDSDDDGFYEYDSD